MNPAAPSVPPSGVRAVQRWVLDSPAQLHRLRASLFEAITAIVGRDGPAFDDVADTLVFVATELATNALRHGLAPSVVLLSRADAYLILDVADHDLKSQPVYDPSRPPGHGGLGLPLVRDMSDELGWYTTDTTKHVWARIPLTPPAESRPVR
jgi:serine/threonine-protein kinase RsbW